MRRLLLVGLPNFHIRYLDSGCVNNLRCYLLLSFQFLHKILSALLFFIFVKWLHFLLIHNSLPTFYYEINISLVSFKMSTFPFSFTHSRCPISIFGQRLSYSRCPCSTNIVNYLFLTFLKTLAEQHLMDGGSSFLLRLFLLSWGNGPIVNRPFVLF